MCHSISVTDYFKTILKKMQIGYRNKTDKMIDTSMNLRQKQAGNRPRAAKVLRNRLQCYHRVGRLNTTDYEMLEMNVWVIHSSWAKVNVDSHPKWNKEQSKDSKKSCQGNSKGFVRFCHCPPSLGAGLSERPSFKLPVCFFCLVLDFLSMHTWNRKQSSFKCTELD